jgi:hypothetical protein
MHFSDESWSDFVRGTADDATRRQMERHLAESCAECSQQVSTWKTVAQFAKLEPSQSPPPDVVRMVKQEFALRHPKRETVWAKLIFDTFSQPLAAGMRSGTVTARQVLYEAGGIAVDLRLESQPNSDHVCAVGQVQDRSKRTFVRPHLPVALLSPNGDTLMQVATNEFGEFQFEFGRQGVARVSIEIDATRTIVIPLSDLEGYLRSS